MIKDRQIKNNIAYIFLLPKINLWLLLLYLFLITISATSIGQNVYKYMCSVDQVDVKIWHREYKRSFDSAGILVQNNEYHALSIAGYGTLNYAEFLSSGDSLYYYKVLNQYKYFCDSSKVVYIDNYKGMGLPYRFNFHDLKAPWYSGMTQGVAISFILRYYKLTKDEEALKKVKQLAYFMLRPQEVGGTIGKTPENYTFIEEYPKSRSNPQVLNGFINGLIGIKEYLNFFPNDTLAKRIHDESYNSMINTFKEYDLPDWTKYNRGSKRISNQYLRYQITEMEHLNFIYSDYRLIKQMMLWSYFAFNKLDKVLKVYKHPLYQYAVPFNIDSNKISNNKIDFEKTLVSDTCFSISRKSKEITNQLKRNKRYSINLKDSVYSAQLICDKNIENANWEFTINNKALAAYSINYRISENKIDFDFKEKFNQIEVRFKNKSEKKLRIEDLKLYQSYQFEIPRFGFYNLKNIEHLKADSTYQFEIQGDYLNETVVFYRFAKDPSSLKKAKYEIGNTISLSDPFFKPGQTGVYQFFMISPMIKGYWLNSPTLKLAKMNNNNT